MIPRFCTAEHSIRKKSKVNKYLGQLHSLCDAVLTQVFDGADFLRLG